MNDKQKGILNAMVTFAAENVPGGLSEEEREVAQLVGKSLGETQVFENLRMYLNLSDYAMGPHIGWAAAYKDELTGEMRLDIRLSPEASERLDKDIAEVLDLMAIGFAGIRKQPEVRRDAAEAESYEQHYGPGSVPEHSDPRGTSE